MERERESCVSEWGRQNVKDNSVGRMTAFLYIYIYISDVSSCEMIKDRQ